jgi:hypothetical protein
MRRSAESQRKSTPEYERAAQRLAAAESSLATLTAELNTELAAFESRRSVDMKNELLTVVACELFVHARAHHHYEQLVPLLPGMARPLLQVVEYARGRPRTNPAETDTVGVIHYAGEASRGVMEKPLQYHHKLAASAESASVHPLPSTKFAVRSRSRLNSRFRELGDRSLRSSHVGYSRGGEARHGHLQPPPVADLPLGGLECGVVSGGASGLHSWFSLVQNDSSFKPIH